MVKGITYILKENAAFQAYIGRNKADTKYKVYPVVCAQPEQFPYSVVRQVGHEPDQCKGIIPTSYQDRYEVLSFHKNYDEVVYIDEAVVAALSIPDGGVVNGVKFQDLRHVNSVDAYVNEYSLYCRISTFEAMVDRSVTLDMTSITLDSTTITLDQG